MMRSMRKMLTVAAVAAPCAVLFAVSAQAGYIGFNLAGSYAESASFNYSSGGIGLTATALSYDTDPGDTSPAVVNRSLYGLGVFSSPNDNNQIDGYGKKEILRITFSVPVKVVAVGFSLGGGPGDDVDISVDGDKIVDDMSTSGWWLTDTFGTQFDFLADNKDDDFKVKKFIVWKDDHKREPSVPEPSAALIFGAGLLVVRRVARRRIAG